MQAVGKWIICKKITTKSNKTEHGTLFLPTEKETVTWKIYSQGSETSLLAHDGNTIIFNTAAAKMLDADKIYCAVHQDDVFCVIKENL